MAENTQIVPSDKVGTTTLQANLNSMMDALVHLGQGDVFFETTCSFCRSAKRADAERLYDNPVGNIARDLAVQKFLADAGESISIDVVRNHVAWHRQRGEIELRRREYITSLASIANVDKSSLTRIRLVMAALEERMAATGSISSDSPRVQAQKTKDINALAKTMTACIEIQAKILGEMRGRGEMVSMPKQRFKVAIENALRNARTTEERQALLKVFEEMEEASE